MNLNQFIFIILISVLCFQCTIQKRLYRPGYSIQFKHKFSNTKNAVSDQKNNKNGIEDSLSIEINPDLAISALDTSERNSSKINPTNLIQTAVKLVGFGTSKAPVFLNQYSFYKHIEAVQNEIKKPKTIEQEKRGAKILGLIASILLLIIIFTFIAIEAGVLSLSPVFALTLVYLILAFVIISPISVAKLMNVKRLRQNESDRLQFQNLSEEDKNKIISKRVRTRKMLSYVLFSLLLIFLALLFLTFFQYMLLLGYTDPDLFLKALLVAFLIITILLLFGLLLLNYKVPIEEMNYRKAQVNKKYKTDKNAFPNEDLYESEVIKKRQKGGLIALIIIVFGALLFSFI